MQKGAEKNESRGLKFVFFRAFRTSKSVLASYLALLLIPAAEFVETREKKTNFAVRLFFFARFGPRKAFWHHIWRSFWFPRQSCSCVLVLQSIPKRIPKRSPRNCGCRRARGGGWPASLRSVACCLLPHSSFLFFLRCSAAPFPTFACPPPSYCSFCSSSHPRPNPSLLLAFCTSASSWLALLLLLGNLFMFRHVSERVVLPASRKFAEDSRKGEAEGDFWSKGRLDNPHIYIYINGGCF